MPRYLTASGLARAEKCAASAALPAVESPDGVYAVAGNDTHGTLEGVARGDREGKPAWLVNLYDELTAGAIAVYAERCYAWDPATLTGRDLGTHQRDYSGLRPGEIGGTADLVVAFASGVTVYDYKSGYFGAPVDSPQMSLLALAVSGAMGLDSITAGIVKIAVDSMESFTKTARLDAFDLAMEAERVARILWGVEQARAIVAAGRMPDVRITEDGCRYCPAKMACPGRSGAIAATMAYAGLSAPGVRILVTPENAGQVWVGIAAMRAVLKAAEDEVEAMARAAPVPLPDGRELWAVETPRETVGDVEAVERLIAEKYGPEAVAEVVEVKKTASKGALETLAKSKAPKGKGAGSARALLAEVRAAGALKQTTHLAYTAKEKKAGLHGYQRRGS